MITRDYSQLFSQSEILYFDIGSLCRIFPLAKHSLEYARLAFFSDPDATRYSRATSTDASLTYSHLELCLNSSIVLFFSTYSCAPNADAGHALASCLLFLPWLYTPLHFSYLNLAI